jgi:hypothetical protein
MADESETPSFSSGRRFKIAFGVVVATLAVLACVVLVNYFGAQFFRRFYLSSSTRVQLSSRTLSVLRSITNRIDIVVYFTKDPDDPFYRDVYPDVAALLKEYASANPKIAVRYIDYVRDPGAAEEFKIHYNRVGDTNKNLIGFECEGRKLPISGEALLETTLVSGGKTDNPNQIALRKKPVAFYGEVMFTSTLLRITDPQPPRIYYLYENGEHDLDESSEQAGYGKFRELARQNYIDIQKLRLFGTNGVPEDCNALMIAGPLYALTPIELNYIEKYLNRGGRLFVLFNYGEVKREIKTGLEKILAAWGVRVGDKIVNDPDNTLSAEQTDIVATCGIQQPDFSHYIPVKHPIINPLVNSLTAKLRLILPREIDAEKSASPDSGIKAEEIFFSGPSSTNRGTTGTQLPSAKPLIVAVEKSPAKGVAAEHGATRIVVTGDSFFLANGVIGDVANADFAANAINWLLERPLLLEGVAPKRIDEYRLAITTAQLNTLQWILLAAIPGGILLLGGLVWIRRRK